MNALQKKSIDYLKVYNRKPEMSSKNRGLILMALPVAAMSVLCGVTAVGMGGKLRSVKAQCDAQRSYLADSAVNEKYSTYDAVLADYSAAVALNTELTDAKSAVSLFPKINSTLINAVKSVTGEGVVIETYSYNDINGTLILNGSCRDFNAAAEYTRRLETLDRFSKVGYHGYQRSDGGDYQFIAECKLKPGSASTISSQR